MPYTIKNSAAKNQFFTAAGVAINTTNQPTSRLQANTIAGVSDSAIPAKDYGLISTTTRMHSDTGYLNRSFLMAYSTAVRNSTSNAIHFPAADYNRPTNDRVRAARVSRKATAVRQGYWNEFSGVFGTTGGIIVPTMANDYSAWGNDGEAIVSKATQGEFAYSYKPIPTYTGYPSRTQ